VTCLKAKMHISKISLIFKHGYLSGLVRENHWPLHNCKTLSCMKQISC